MQEVVLLATQADLDVVAKEIASHKLIAVDTETTGLDPLTHRMRLLQIGTPKCVYIIDCFKVVDLRPLQPLLTSPETLKLFHNAKFDLKMLQWHHKISPAPLFDTMIADILLTLGDGKLSHTLASVAERYLGIILDKRQQTSDWSANELSAEQLTYAAEDVCVLLRLYPVLQAALNARGLGKVSDMEFAAAIPTAHLELNGFLLDGPAWRSELEAANKDLSVLQKELDAILGEKVANSPAKLRSALEMLGVVGLENTSAETLQLHSADHPVIGKLLEWRKLQKLSTSYGGSLLELISPCTGRLHAQFNQFGAVSGRYSCSAPNLQQVPREDRWRACFRAPESWSFVIADYSQIELRVLAALSLDERLLKLYRRGLDLHRFTAATITRKPMADVGGEERRLAKAINFGITFGMGANGLSKYAKTSYGVSLSPREAQGHLNLFFEIFPGVRRWQFKAVADARESGYIKTMTGRLIALPKNGYWTKSLNYPVQGSAAEGLKQALLLLHKALPAINGRLVCIIHDEIIIEVPNEKVGEGKQILHSAMIRGMQSVIGDVPVELEMRCGPTWAKGHNEKPLSQPSPDTAICPAPGRAATANDMETRRDKSERL